jgi:hypothetical protein
LDRHVSTLSAYTVAQAQEAAQALARAFRDLPNTIDGEVEAAWEPNGDPTPSVLRLVPAKGANAHGALAIAAHQGPILAAVAAWGAQCPLLWARAPKVKTHADADDNRVYVQLKAGKPAALRLLLDNPVVRSLNIIEAPIGPKGVELVRFATLIASVQEPLQAWTSKAGQKEEHYYAGDIGTAAAIDRLLRSPTGVLKTGKANTPAGMRYSICAVPVDAQAVFDHIFKG